MSTTEYVRGRAELIERRKLRDPLELVRLEAVATESRCALAIYIYLLWIERAKGGKIKKFCHWFFHIVLFDGAYEKLWELLIPHFENFAEVLEGTGQSLIALNQREKKVAECDYLVLKLGHNAMGRLASVSARELNRFREYSAAYFRFTVNEMRRIIRD